MVDIELHELDLRYAALRRRDARRERALVASLAESGQQVPVVVVRGETGPFVLVDGYQRVRALARLHRDTVEAVVWGLSELEALLLVRGLRSAAGDTALEQGWLLRELHERFGLTAGELAQRSTCKSTRRNLGCNFTSSTSRKTRTSGRCASAATFG